MENSNSENQWYWSKRSSEERNGPVDRERLEGLAAEGTLEPEDIVWRKGFDDWKEAGSVEEIEELFASPPPLPEDSSDENDDEETPPPISESEKSEPAEEYDFPIEFKTEKSNIASSGSTGSRNIQKASESEEKSWYNKKRWIVPLSVLAMSAVFFSYYVYYESLKKADEFEENRGEVIKKINNKGSLDDKIYENNNYIAALWWTGKKEESRALHENLDSLKIEKVYRQEGLKRSIKVAKEYAGEEDNRAPRKYGGENFRRVLDSLRVERAKRLMQDYEKLQENKYERKLELLGSAKDNLSSIKKGKYMSPDKVENKLKEISRKIDKTRRIKNFANISEEEREDRAVSLCEDKVREEHDVVKLFGRAKPSIGGIADENSSYPGSVLDIGDGEYIVDGFVATEYISPENLTGDAYSGTYFECKVEVTKSGIYLRNFFD
ncbi:hypothetical protein GGP89_002836 [Salinibacter ruber]|uniref:GYF domain-containing protein n=1 Tax=Salinibacter ruber TaxID=146919 RepID=A0A9X2U3S0_9BACT|nr:DUF4339 domain-containing protein [Salinibacter ruber]MCS3859435.1 hypothetical protein [Salinibacter ruber]MCS3866315.1 hypothetical protein [Salinibacter ruber]